MSLFTVDPDRCKRDGMCVRECPARIIEMRDKESCPTLVAGGEAFCINCGHCVAVCPHGALSLETMPSGECRAVSKELMPSPEQVDHVLRTRRSIRIYREETLDRETLAELIDTARYAPSAHNCQPVHWLVIEKKEEVTRLAAVIIDWMQELLATHAEIAETLSLHRAIDSWNKGVDRVLRRAPHLVVVHAPSNLPLSHIDCAIALSYLELAAVSRGLGACWSGYTIAAASSYEPMRDALSLPEGHKCFGAMMIGRPAYSYHRVPLRNAPSIAWR